MNPDLTLMIIIHYGLVFDFPSYLNWVNTARTKFKREYKKGAGDKDFLCVDAVGRICVKGAEFMRARDEKTFPIKTYRIIQDPKPKS
jgi:hypothetical protein